MVVIPPLGGPWENRTLAWCLQSNYSATESTALIEVFILPWLSRHVFVWRWGATSSRPKVFPKHNLHPSFWAIYPLLRSFVLVFLLKQKNSKPYLMAQATQLRSYMLETTGMLPLWQFLKLHLFVCVLIGYRQPRCSVKEQQMSIRDIPSWDTIPYLPVLSNEK